MKPLHRFFKGAALLLSLLAVCAAAPPVQSAEEKSPHSITPNRIAALPAAQRALWQAYYDRSQKHLSEEKAYSRREVKAAGLEKPLAAPGNSGFGGF